MQTRSSDEKDVWPSVRLSVKRMNCDEMERKICPDFLYHTKGHLS